MITRKNAFVVGDTVFATLELAQRSELATLLHQHIAKEPADIAAEVIVANKDKVLDVLTTSETSRPKARKVNGGKKQRKAASTETPQPTAA